MFTELYIGALLADERLADFVWDLWNGDEIDGPTAGLCWSLITATRCANLADFHYTKKAH